MSFVPLFAKRQFFAKVKREQLYWVFRAEECTGTAVILSIGRDVAHNRTETAHALFRNPPYK